MPRIVVSNEELTKLINEKIRQLDTDGDCQHDVIEGDIHFQGPDSTGCNWREPPIRHNCSGPYCKPIVDRAIKEIRAKYNLRAKSEDGVRS